MGWSWVGWKGRVWGEPRGREGSWWWLESGVGRESLGGVGWGEVTGSARVGYIQGFVDR